jgi:hypothetical protein
MTDTEKVKAIAELDGYSNISERGGIFEGYRFSNPKETGRSFIPPYLTSRDAIVPVILKVIAGKVPQLREMWHQGLLSHTRFQKILNSMEIFNLLEASPSQLCESLLRMTGKCIE